MGVQPQFKTWEARQREWAVRRELARVRRSAAELGADLSDLDDFQLAPLISHLSARARAEGPTAAELLLAMTRAGRPAEGV